MTKSDIYYSQNPMQVYESRISRYFNRFTKNFSREEVAAEIDLGGEKCLDVACGDGELVNRFLFKKYVIAEGVDISANLISSAKNSKRKNCYFYVSDIEKFIDESLRSGKKYDDIYMLAILEHVLWPSVLINKIYKLLNKNGHVIVEVPNVSWLPHRISLLLGKFPETAPTLGAIPGVYDEHVRFFTLNTLDKMFKDNNLRRIRLDCSGKFRKIKMLYPKLLSPDIVAVYKKT